MLLTKNKTVRVIGYKQSTITQEAIGMLEKEDITLEVISPEDLLIDENDLQSYSYFIAFTLDKLLRKKVIEKIESKELDSIIYIHNSCVCYFDVSNENEVRKIIGHGTFISPMSSVLLHSKIGKHCIIETYCLVSHYAELGENVHLHSGVLIAGRTKVGDNSEFNFRSTVLPALTLCEGIELGAVSTVTKDITVPGKYVGTPARRINNV